MPILVPNRDERPASQAQIKRAYAIGVSHGLTSAEVDQVANKKHGVKNPSHLASSTRSANRVVSLR